MMKTPTVDVERIRAFVAGSSPRHRFIASILGAAVSIVVIATVGRIGVALLIACLVVAVVNRPRRRSGSAAAPSAIPSLPGAPPPVLQVAASGDPVRDAIAGALVNQRIPATVTPPVVGPRVSRYGIYPPINVKAEKITAMERTFQVALGQAAVRVVAPVPGCPGMVGVELPHGRDRVVTLAEVLSSPMAQQIGHPLLTGLGVTVEGGKVVVDLAALPHLLVGGVTGSGKSTLINTLLVSILRRSTPDEVQLLLIDPKRVELIAYEGLPHLVTPIVTDPLGAAMALQWAMDEVDRRYKQLAAARCRNIEQYNARGGQLSRLLVIVDELADLMMSGDKDEIERLIVRIEQLGRGAGVHLVLATQRPSVNVVTGLIKANAAARLAFAVASAVDSRVILDQGGAEALLGRGDALFLPQGEPAPIRVQVAMVSEVEVAAAVARWGARAQPAPVDLAAMNAPRATRDDSQPPVGTPAPADAEDDDAELLRLAAGLVVTSQFGSTSMLQRKLRIGFTRAGRLMDELQALGVVGPSDGSRARDVLIQPEHLQGLMDRLRRRDGGEGGSS